MRDSGRLSRRLPEQRPPHRPHSSCTTKPSDTHFVRRDGSTRDRAACPRRGSQQSFPPQNELKSLRSSLFCDLGDQSIDREQASPEDQDHQRCEQEGIWIGHIELSWIGEDCGQRLSIGGPVCNEHVAGHEESDRPGEETKHHENTANKLQRRNERRIESRKRDIEASEEACDLC